MVMGPVVPSIFLNSSLISQTEQYLNDFKIDFTRYINSVYLWDHGI